MMVTDEDMSRFAGNVYVNFTDVPGGFEVEKLGVNRGIVHGGSVWPDSGAPRYLKWAHDLALT